MSNELTKTIELYKAIPDLACLMLVKICKMLLAAIETFQHTAATNAPWTRFFEGIQEIDVKDWKRPEKLEHQPKWRLNWFKKHPTTINADALAPRELQTNVVFCPCICKRSWTQFAKIYSTRPNYLNYPVLRGRHLRDGVRNFICLMS